MKNKNKICIFILTGIYIFFISIFNVKALAVTDFTYIQAFSSGNGCTKEGVAESGREYGTSLYGGNGCTLNWTNFGEANYLVIPIFLYIQEWENMDTTNTYYGSVYDKSTQIILITDVGNVYCDYDGTYATCPWHVADATRLTNINFITTKGGGISIGYYVRIANGWWTADTIANTNSNIQNNTNDIKNKMNEDISNSDKEAPNQTEYNNAKQQEDNIIQSISNVSANDITFSQDLRATNKIWDTTTRFLQTNAKVMGLVISILSIGIIKLIMNR